MTRGHPGELHFLAFDHRGSFAREILGTGEDLTEDQIERVRAAKRLVFDGALRAASRIAPRERVGVLVDEHFGGDIPALALENGITLAVAVERSSRDVFEFEYGEAFRAHIERLDPTFAKVLVRFNVEGDADVNAVQLERLKPLAEFVGPGRWKLMYELLVPPTEAQLGRFGGDRERYRRELRPELIRRGIAATQDAGIEPDIWKLEGVDRLEDAAAIVAQVRCGAERQDVRCLVLGAGAPQQRVEHWLDVAARTEGYGGFAIGRSIWSDPVRRHLDHELSGEETSAIIASRFERFVERWDSMRSSDPARGSADSLE